MPGRKACLLNWIIPVLILAVSLQSTVSARAGGAWVAEQPRALANQPLADGPVRIRHSSLSDSLDRSADFTSTRIAAVAGGWYHTCALTSGGSVKCWGENEVGQLGDGTTTDHSTPIEVSGLPDGVTAIAAGLWHTCALTSEGGVKCWGANFYGELGDGTMDSRYTPVDVNGLAGGVTAIATGVGYTCALTWQGGVKCWGSIASVQHSNPTAVSGLESGVTMLAVGANHTCALVSGGGVKCWGANDAGQLGDGTTTWSDAPVDVSGLASGVTGIAAGGKHTCALAAGGVVKCWGENGAAPGKSLTPLELSGLTGPLTAITAGEKHTCGLSVGGAVKCWGMNDSGQLGDGMTAWRFNPLDVNGLAGDVLAIAAGRFHTCAVISGGGLKCWGANDSGQLGDGTTTDHATPIGVSELTNRVTAVAAGDKHTCALTSGGGVKCWGANNSGQLGDGTTTWRVTPVDVSGLTGAVKAVAAGGDHTCALTSGGAVKCWGANKYGQLGDGTTTDRASPVQVSGLTSGVTALAVGALHTCALASGGVKCWGANYSGQLGDDTTTDHPTPVDTGGGLTSGVSALAAGASHTCALRSDGMLECWGENHYGQLGDGTTVDRVGPFNILGGVTLVAAGGWHTCVRLSGGGVKCWGANYSGQLGDGTLKDHSTPVDVSGLAGVVTALAAGRTHTCALTSHGLNCWGANSSGQLGDGTKSDRSIPTFVTGLTSPVTAITAGRQHTCVRNSGGVKCWGSNGSGQLGHDPGWSPVNVILWRIYVPLNLRGTFVRP
jgi:alpha-tubulin suppressor-like RCC1 family protein